jgi:NAD(P)-dependent dehydrogenase (short-subunit alcohol dehydrogenase family)
VPTDVSSETECRRLVAQTVEAFGGLDALVNNAGISMWARFDELQDLSTIADARELSELRLPHHAALPHLSGRGGTVTASLAGLPACPRQTATASKHAVFGFFDSLRTELAGMVSAPLVAPLRGLGDPQALGGPDGRPLAKSPMQGAKLDR